MENSGAKYPKIVFGTVAVKQREPCVGFEAACKYRRNARHHFMTVLAKRISTVFTTEQRFGTALTASSISHAIRAATAAAPTAASPRYFASSQHSQAWVIQQRLWNMACGYGILVTAQVRRWKDVCSPKRRSCALRSDCDPSSPRCGVAVFALWRGPFSRLNVAHHYSTVFISKGPSPPTFHVRVKRKPGHLWFCVGAQLNPTSKLNPQWDICCRQRRVAQAATVIKCFRIR